MSYLNCILRKRCLHNCKPVTNGTVSACFIIPCRIRAEVQKLYSMVLGDDGNSPNLSLQELSCNSYINQRQRILSQTINTMVQIDVCCILAALPEGRCYSGSV